MENRQKKDLRDDFYFLVNMDRAELARWLDTDEAKSVGWTATGLKKQPGGQKSEGYKSGELILGILEKAVYELDDADYTHMRRVRGYIKRHLAQRPNKDITHTRWRYSLVNWGHDPLK